MNTEELEILARIEAKCDSILKTLEQTKLYLEPETHQCPGEFCSDECNQPMAPKGHAKAFELLDKQFYAAQASFRK